MKRPYVSHSLEPVSNKEKAMDGIDVQADSKLKLAIAIFWKVLESV